MVKSYPENEPGDGHHPFSIIRDDREDDHLAGHNSNIDLEELQPPQDRVVVREDIYVKYWKK